MSSQTKILLEAFNNTFKEFLKELCIVFPINDDLKKYKNAYNLLVNVTPKLVIPLWENYVNEKYYEQIMGSNIDAFIDKDYTMDVRNLGGQKLEALEFIDKIREPLRNLDENNKNTSINYIRNLCKLSRAYKEQSN
jgi:hypothetical protein